MDTVLFASLSESLKALVLSVLSIVQFARGQFFRIVWESVQKPSAKFKALEGRLIKRCEGNVRLGVAFENKASVKDGIESGERGEVGSLRWGAWMLFPWFIVHKGKAYLRAEPDGKIESQFYLDGVAISREEGLSYLPPSASESGKPETMNLNLESIVSINGIPIKA
jgi:hypothetical protein